MFALLAVVFWETKESDLARLPGREVAIEQARLWGEHVAWMRRVQAVTAYSTHWEGELLQAEQGRLYWERLAEAHTSWGDNILTALGLLRDQIGERRWREGWSPARIDSAAYPLPRRMRGADCH